jgi:hypothetical protein
VQEGGTVVDALATIYARIPRLNCKRKCQESCGPLGIFPAEAERIRAKHYRLPVVNGALECSGLREDGACRIYADRPVLCRLWGTVKAMRCPHGCKPSRWLSDEEARLLMLEVQQLKAGEPTMTLPESMLFVHGRP